MKLDRNTNRGGRGKYALVNMRKLIPYLDGSPNNMGNQAITHAFECLVENGIISLGNETPGDQFFVMKYKDRFAWPSLFAYAEAVKGHADHLRKHHATNPQSDSLDEYAAQMKAEARTARQLGERIPD